MDDLGFSYQRPRAKYPERDESKREIAKVEIKKTFEYCAENPETVVLFQDEFSLSNTATLSATWALKGQQPEIPCKQAKPTAVNFYILVHNFDNFSISNRQIIMHF